MTLKKDKGKHYAPRIFFSVLFIALIVIFPSIGWGQNPPVWRYWNTLDGFDEPTSMKVSIGPDGTVYVNHGHVKHSSVLDGYSVRQIPNPMPHGKIRENKFHQIWSTAFAGVDAGIFVQFDKSLNNWIKYPSSLRSILKLDSMWNSVPAYRDRVIYVNPDIPDKLFEFNAETGITTDILDVSDTKLHKFSHCLRVSLDGKVLIPAMNGLMVLEKSNDSFGTFWKWQEYPFPDDLQLQNLTFPIQGRADEIYGSAFSEETGQKVLVCLTGRNWDIIYANKDQSISAGWKESNNRLWLLIARASISIVETGQERDIEKNDHLSSGFIPDFAVAENDVFWFALAKGGLARYAPATWQTPLSLAEMDDEISLITEDLEGRMWFSNNKQLYRYTDEKITVFSYPDIKYVRTMEPKNMIVLPTVK